MIISSMKPAMGSLLMLGGPAAPGCDGPRLQATEKANRTHRQNRARRGDDELSGLSIFGILSLSPTLVSDFSQVGYEGCEKCGCPPRLRGVSGCLSSARAQRREQ